MTNERDDDPVAELRAALAVEPAPGFIARTRGAVAADEHRRSAVRWIPIAGVAGAVIVAGATWLVHVDWRRPVGAVATRPTVVAPTARPVSGHAPEIVAAARAKGPVVDRGVARSEASASVGPVEPEVLVPDDQRLALDHLLAGLRAGTATMPPVVAPTVDEEGFLAPLPSVAVPPLPEPALLGPGGDPGKARSW